MPESPQDKFHVHPWKQTKASKDLGGPAGDRRAPRSAFVELCATSNFTFLTGASHPDELVNQAAALGYHALGVTDTNTLAGIVRAHVAAKEAGMQLVVGTRVMVDTGGGSDGATKRRSDGGADAQQTHDHNPSSLRRSVAPSLASPSLAPSLAVFLYPTDLASYGRLCRLLTTGKRRAPKGQCHLTLHDVVEHHEGLLAIAVAPLLPTDDDIARLLHLNRTFDNDRLSLAAACLYQHDDAERLERLADLSRHTAIPLVATNDVHYHVPERRMLQDVLTCISHGCTLDEAGLLLLPNAERHLKPPEEMQRLFATLPGAITRTVEVADRCAGFSLDQLRYHYPDEVVPPGKTAMEHLRELTWRGAEEKYGAHSDEATKRRSDAGEDAQQTQDHNPSSLRRSVASSLSSASVAPSLPAKVRHQIEHELQLIDELNYAHYFLTVHDLVVYARSRGILCQGRGAAANSAVCYCLGVTSVDPERIDLLFERFISKERDEPPDIDIDFEHERREEVIQYIYAKYGRHRAALTAEVVSYRGRSAVREIGKALGLSLDLVDRLAKNIDWWAGTPVETEQLIALGLNPADPTLQRLMQLSVELQGFPRHLSQHVGGFVMANRALCEMVPIENAAMPNRTIVEWDKDDIDAVGMMKVDVLGLGMLTVISKAFRLVTSKWEATKRRSDGATKGLQYSQPSKGLDHGADVPGSHRVAESNDISGGDLPADRPHADVGTVWSDESDEACGILDPFQYRGGAWPTEPRRLPEVFANRPRLPLRVEHPVRTGDTRHPVDPAEHRNDTTDRGRGSHPASLDSQLGSQKELTRCTPTPPSLRRSVAPSLQLHTIPPEDPSVYAMLQRADSIGVFQVESRAQMSMLPRLKPKNFYDLVIEVAIVRPGPIQGDMVHPYLRRRNGEEPVHFFNDVVKQVLGKTLGVPLFQEQAMRLAIDAAGFTPGEADQLRRAINAWKTRGNKIHAFGQRIIDGMLAHGYPRKFAETCFEQIKGFSGYGFPESHAASFALLVYVSAWLKCHHPDAFTCALLNSQPMGFYAPAQLVRDAQNHGVSVREADVNFSEWDCTLEESDEATERRSDGGEDAQQTQDHNPSSPRRSVAPSLLLPLRLGLRQIKSLRQPEAQLIVDAVRKHGRFRSIESLWRTSGVRAATMKTLAAADAFRSMGIDRQAAMWEVRKLKDEDAPLFADVMGNREGDHDSAAALPPLAPMRHVVQDYDTTGLSLKRHPIAFIRDWLDEAGVTPAAELQDEKLWPAGEIITVAGLCLVRQRPGTASGVVFMTLEDETGISNLIVRPAIYDTFKQAARHAGAMLVKGRVERQGLVVHVLAHRISSLDDRLRGLLVASRNFR